MPADPAPALTILEPPSVVQRGEHSRPVIRRLGRAGQFPRSIRLRSKSVGGSRESDVVAWIAMRAEARRSCLGAELTLIDHIRAADAAGICLPRLASDGNSAYQCSTPTLMRRRGLERRFTPLMVSEMAA
jgi:predicted DNA-binding transcriptional regulator AlpA